MRLIETDREGMAVEVIENGQTVGFVGYNGSQYTPDGKEVGILTYKESDQQGFATEVEENWTWTPSA